MEPPEGFYFEPLREVFFSKRPLQDRMVASKDTFGNNAAELHKLAELPLPHLDGGGDRKRKINGGEG